MLNFILSQFLSDKDWEKFVSTNELQLLPSSSNTNIIDYLRQKINEGIETENKEINLITNNTEAPTFINTIVALSKTGFVLGRAESVLFNLLSAETSDEMDALANDVSSLLSEHENNIMLNEALFQRVKSVYDKERNTLQGEDLMLLNKTYENFERSGATLNEEKKSSFREITMKLSELTLQFSQNLLKETNNYYLHITKTDELEGISDIHIKAAAHEAKQRRLKGWVFTLHAPSYGPFMMYSTQRHYRKEMYLAYNSRCTHDNEFNNNEIVRKIVNLRCELSQLLGFHNYAEYALRRRMAANADNVYHLLNQIIESYLPKAKEEIAEVVQKAKELEGEDFQLMPWDFSFYSQKLKEERYNYDPNMLRPYFELNEVKKGVFGLATKLYGITFKNNNSIPVYQKDVTAYNVYDKNGDFLALLLVDFFPRKSKKGGAWMTDYRGEHADIPTSEKVTAKNSFRPVVSITTNFTQPTADTPALLTLEELQTFLHEFGHALHSIFAMTHYEALSGTSVYWDFVELPSQFMENYAIEPEFLGTFAYHYQTKEPLPQAYIERIRKSRNFQAAYMCIRQVSFGLLDMAYYTQTAPLSKDIKCFEDEAWKKVQLLPSVPETCMSVQFSHIMAGGYAAGYYSYKWAEVLDADAFSLFQQKGIFNTDVAQSFRNNILSQGGTKSPMQLYKEFRGQEPTIDALLKRDGIK